MTEPMYNKGDLMLGPQTGRGPTIYEYDRMYVSNDGDILHSMFLATDSKGMGDQDQILLRDRAFTKITTTYFTVYNQIWYLDKANKTGVYVCTVGKTGDHNIELKAQKISDYLEKAGEAWTREFHALSIDDSTPKR